MKEFLKVIAAAGGMAAFIACPVLPFALYPFVHLGKNTSEYSKKRERERLLKSLLKNDLVSIEGDRVKITEKGGLSLDFQRLNEIDTKRKGAWDGKWRLVVFDVPEEKRIAREYFRSFLKRVGFHLLQKSVFICPYVCEKEVREAAEILGIWDYISLMRVDRIDKEEELLGAFKLY